MRSEKWMNLSLPTLLFYFDPAACNNNYIHKILQREKWTHFSLLSLLYHFGPTTCNNNNNNTNLNTSYVNKIFQRERKGAQDGGMWNGRVRVGSAENENLEKLKLESSLGEVTER